MAVAVPAGRGLFEFIKSLLAQPGGLGAIARGALGGLAAFGVGALIQHFLNNPEDKMVLGPRSFALIDVANDRIILFMSARRAYRILLRPRGRRIRRLRPQFIVSPQGQQITKVE